MDVLAYLNLASIRFCTESEGPGKRVAIWVQGCLKSCVGCCNPEMQKIEENVVVETQDLINIIQEEKIKNNIEGITLLGGEPILQAQGLSEIAEWSRKNGLSVILFTGYLFEELKNMKNSYVQHLLKYTDILIDGPFENEMHDTKRAWVGSKNQRVIYLSDFYKKGIEYEIDERQMEILVSNGEIYLNGWPYI